VFALLDNTLWVEIKIEIGIEVNFLNLTQGIAGCHCIPFGEVLRQGFGQCSKHERDCRSPHRFIEVLRKSLDSNGIC
jgi:hypothetical protein